MAQILVALIVLASYRKRPWNHGHYGMPAGLLFIIIILDFSCYVLVWFGMVQRIQEISPKLHHNERDTITMLGVMMVAGSIGELLTFRLHFPNFVACSPFALKFFRRYIPLISLILWLVIVLQTMNDNSILIYVFSLDSPRSQQDIHPVKIHIFAELPSASSSRGRS